MQSSSTKNWVPDLLGMAMLDARKALQVTVLRREGGTWLAVEVSRMVEGLRTEASQRRDFPEHLLLFGHFSKEQTLAAIGGGFAYTATQVTGVSGLPFKPGWTA